MTWRNVADRNTLGFIENDNHYNPGHCLRFEDELHKALISFYVLEQPDIGFKKYIRRVAALKSNNTYVNAILPFEIHA